MVTLPPLLMTYSVMIMTATIFDTLCQVQAFVGFWMLGSSLTWTLVLALHFFLVTVHILLGLIS